ncbi:MAG: rhamnogalacturonan acetylesterase [Treponema sp.]|nr:rhamnogalacturonan acetylesterase [Treponema sp.]
MKLICMGDSIMQYNTWKTYPQTGWVQMLDRFLLPGIQILNFARNGRSTKSFINEGRFEKVLINTEPKDIVLIQFAHNDEKKQDESRYTDCCENGEFRKNLEFFVKKIKEKKALPILLTPVVRRNFISQTEIENTHGDYPLAIIETAKKLNVPFVDITSLSKKYFEDIGDEKSKSFFMNFEKGIYSNYHDGKNDNSHLRPDGAFCISLLAAESFCSMYLEWPEYEEFSKSIVLNENINNDVEIDDEYLMWRS